MSKEFAKAQVSVVKAHAALINASGTFNAAAVRWDALASLPPHANMIPPVASFIHLRVAGQFPFPQEVFLRETRRQLRAIATMANVFMPLNAPLFQLNVKLKLIILVIPSAWELSLLILLLLLASMNLRLTELH
jgi:hypothetical protein